MSLESQISQLQTQVGNLQSRVSHLGSSNIQLANDVTTVKNTVVPYQQVVNNITQNVSGSGLAFQSENKDSIILIKGTPVTQDASGSGILRADASANNKTVVGICNADIPVGIAGDVIGGGIMILSDWTAITGSSSLVAKGKYYLSAVAGKLTNTAPITAGFYNQLVGIAVDSQTLEIKISNPILL